MGGTPRGSLKGEESFGFRVNALSDKTETEISYCVEIALVSLQRMAERLGPEVLYGGDGSALVDIVFVHGLRGDRLDSWRSNDSGGVLWPQETLVRDFPHSRVITWGYDANVSKLFSGSSQDTIVGHSENLLSDIASLRFESEEDETRPIIFIGHNLGGLIIKQALIRASIFKHNDERPDEAGIYEHTKCVIFLGTPHRGSEEANKVQSEIWSNVIKLVSSADRNNSILDVMKRGSQILEAQRGNFSSVSNNIRVICAYEEYATPSLGLIVPKDSAIIDGRGIVPVAIPATHYNMSRFSSSSQTGYKRLLMQMRQSLRGVITKEKIQEAEHQKATQSLLR